MVTLSICASKGGVGKTTLAAGLSSLAVEDGLKVAIIDFDPQQSLARWWELREKRDNPRLITEVDTITEAVNVLTDNGFDLIIIDTPPALMSRVEPAIESADLVIVPVRPSPIDVEAVDPVVTLANKYKRPFVFVLTMVGINKNLKEGAADYLKVDGEVLKEEISYCELFSSAMIEGKTASEIDGGKSHQEMNALWRSIKERLQPRVSEVA